jgi:Fur family ferric uptake transcriptional regulator
MPAVPEPRPPQERSTRQKRALALVLRDIDQFLSAQDLHGQLIARGERVGLTTVYNQLRALAEAGEVDSIRTPGGETLYRRCATEVHHHHLVCRRCGTTVEVETPEVERWATATASRHGFVDVRHTIEITGLCAGCGRPSTRAR